MRRALVLLPALVAVSCREPARPDALPAPPAPLASASSMPPEALVTAQPEAPAPSASAIAVAGSAFPRAAEIEWAGDPGFPSAAPRGRALAIVAKDDLVEVEVDKEERLSTVQRVRFHRDLVWQHRLPEEFVPDATVLVDAPGRRVYVAHYSAISSGATLYGLDLATGARRWAKRVQGLGPVSHSKYYNHVTLAMVRGALVAFGDEAQGRYVEVFDPESGRMLSTRMLPAGR